MWKESYRIGIDPIDIQHKELFRMTDDLLRAIEGNYSKDIFREAIRFLKNYVVLHFKEEELYQESIGYSGIKEHKKEHQKFTNLVLDYEKKLMDSNYDIPVIKDLAGTLTAWLIYHVTDADQRIAGNLKDKVFDKKGSYIDSLAVSILDVLEKMAGLDRKNVEEKKIENRQVCGDIFVQIEIVGDIKGRAVFGFTKELAFQLIEIMTFIKPVEFDELVCSALSEIANITSGNAITELAQRSIRCDIKPPVVSLTLEKNQDTCEGICIHTSIGGMEVEIQTN